MKGETHSAQQQRTVSFENCIPGTQSCLPISAQ